MTRKNYNLPVYFKNIRNNILPRAKGEEEYVFDRQW
jgi:hypothetical protein